MIQKTKEMRLGEGDDAEETIGAGEVAASADAESGLTGGSQEANQQPDDEDMNTQSIVPLATQIHSRQVLVR